MLRPLRYCQISAVAEIDSDSEAPHVRFGTLADIAFLSAQCPPSPRTRLFRGQIELSVERLKESHVDALIPVNDLAYAAAKVVLPVHEL